MDKGLYEKYTVINNKTGKQIEGMVFVLLPDHDVVALKALETYVEYTDNVFLKEDLHDFIKHQQRLKGEIGMNEVKAIKIHDELRQKPSESEKKVEVLRKMLADQIDKNVKSEVKVKRIR